MNCPHRGVRWDGTCDACGAQLAPPPATVIVARLARCTHRAVQVFSAPASRISVTICDDCGSVRLGKGVKEWTPPRIGVLAKQLDEALRLGGLDALDGEDDSPPKNVIPMKPRR